MVTSCSFQHSASLYSGRTGGTSTSLADCSVLVVLAVACARQLLAFVLQSIVC